LSWYHYLSVPSKLNEGIADTLKTKVTKVFPMEQFEEAIKYYEQNMSLGKVVLKPRIWSY